MSYARAFYDAQHLWRAPFYYQIDTELMGVQNGTVVNMYLT